MSRGDMNQPTKPCYGLTPIANLFCGKRRVGLILYQRKHAYETHRPNPWNCPDTIRQHCQRARTRRLLWFLAVLAAGIGSWNCDSRRGLGSPIPDLCVCPAGLPIRLRVSAATAFLQHAAGSGSARSSVDLRTGCTLGAQLARARPLGSRSSPLQLRRGGPNKSDCVEPPAGHAAGDKELLGRRCSGLHGIALGILSRRVPCAPR